MVGYVIGYILIGLLIAIIATLTELCKENEPVISGIIAVLWPAYILGLFFIICVSLVGLIIVALTKLIKKHMFKKKRKVR